MKRTLNITVYPASLAGDYLTVSDAMRQMLDMVQALESFEEVDGSVRRIVWRLVEAHTNSPPFSITAEAFSVDPAVSISFEANWTTTVFRDAFRSISVGVIPSYLDKDTINPIKRILERNLNGIGRTEIVVDDEVVNIVPSSAKIAVLAIERAELELESAIIDHRHTEYGSVECIVLGLTKWNNKKALQVIDRLRGNKLPCVLGEDIARKLGQSHKWEEAWQGRRLLVAGALHYGQDGDIKRIDAEDADDLPFTSVDLKDLQQIDVLRGRSVSDHVRLLRGE